MIPWFLIATATLIMVIPLCYLIASFKKEEQFFPLKDISHYTDTYSTKKIFKPVVFVSSGLYFLSYLNQESTYILFISVSLFGLSCYSHSENYPWHLFFALMYFITLITFTTIHSHNIYLNFSLWLMLFFSLLIKIAKLDYLRRLISLFEWMTCSICNTYLIIYYINNKNYFPDKVI